MKPNQPNKQALAEAIRSLASDQRRLRRAGKIRVAKLLGDAEGLLLTLESTTQDSFPHFEGDPTISLLPWVTPQVLRDNSQGIHEVGLIADELEGL
ncbi:MAG: hypothetical protein ACE5HE_00260 [Phycisphaerae bacterium]